MATGKFLFRKVEKAIEAIDRAADPSATIMQTASTVIEQFADVLGVRGGRLYVRCNKPRRDGVCSPRAAQARTYQCFRPWL